jgi:PiT family inorganic phosphate transporter
MGIIALALVAHGDLSSENFSIPLWVVISSAAAIALGTYSGGWRIIHTLGHRIIKMDPVQGFGAQNAGAVVIMIASHVGFPLSTTHVISGGIMGAGASKRLSAVKWGVARDIVLTWVLTLPGAAFIGASMYGASLILGGGISGSLVLGGILCSLLILGLVGSLLRKRIAGASV